MNSIKLLILTISLLAWGPHAGAEVLHVERYMSGGKAVVRVIVPEIYQTDSGVVVITAIAIDSGPTLWDQWFFTQHEVSFPVLAISRRIDLSGWTGDERRPLGSLIFVGAQSFFDRNDPAEPNTFEYSRNGGWVDSLTLGQINVLHYPWIYQESLGWTYVKQAEPIWRGMAWWGYSLERGWVYFAESVPDFIHWKGRWEPL